MIDRRSTLGLLSAGGVLAAARPGAPTPQPMPAVSLGDHRVRTIENVWIPMPDGARLAARLFLPASGVAGGAVLEYLPYRKRDGYRYRDDVVGPVLAANGFAFVRVDIRGTGDSDGVMIDEYDDPEQADALTVIDWIARQPWCNGAVGMRGISYGSFTALQAAAKVPAALKAIVSACGTEQRYQDDVHYRGGCLIQDQLFWGMEWAVILRGPPDPAIVGAQQWRGMWEQRLAAARPVTIDWNEHQTDDAKWRSGSIDDYGAIRAAVFNVAGVMDSYLPSATRMMERAPQVPQKALIGPWGHKWPGYPDPAGHRGQPTAAANGNPGPGVDWLPQELRWWRQWLGDTDATKRTTKAAGADTGMMREPAIWAFREDRPPGASWPRDTIGSWVSEPAWPSPRIKTQQLWLNTDGLGTRPGAQTRLRHATDLAIGFATRTSDSSGDPKTWPREQSGDDALSLRFDGAPLAQSLDIMGEPLLRIRVRADRPVAKLFARLTEVTPDGQSHFVSYALLNLTHRDGDVTPRPLVPGQDYDVTLSAKFCCYRFAAGSRIRIALSETWWPVAWPSPEPVVLEATAGASTLELPVRPMDAGDPALPFAVLRGRYDVPGAPPSPYHERLGDVTVGGAPGARTYTVVEGSDVESFDQVAEVGTRYGEAYKLVRTITEGDPNSAVMECTGINSYARGDWQVRLRAWSRLRSTTTHFLCEETFEAFEGETRVFSRRWEKSIPRVLV